MEEKDIKYFRCTDEGRLITARQIRQGVCVGHKLKAANYVTLWEWIACKLKIIH